MKIKVSIVIPTYNEAEGILIFLKRLELVFKELNKKYEFEAIIVDDSSPDKTAEIIKKIYKKEKWIKVFVRKGVRELGTAIKLGIEKSRGEIIIGIDADGNHRVQKIPLLLKELKYNDLIVASRFIKGGGVEKKQDYFRHLISFSVNFIFKLLGSPVWDSTSGFYAIYKKKLKNLSLKKIYYGYGDYHLGLVYFAKMKKYKIKEIPSAYKKRIAGQSKSRLFNMFFSYFIEVLKLRFNI